MTTDLPAEGLVDRVRAVVPLIASTSFEAEAQRRPLDEVIDALKATGVFRSFVPARYGGYEIDMSTYVDIGLAVAHADPSMGWVTTFYMEHNWLLTIFAEELQDEIFGAQPFVLAPGTVNPSGRAVLADDGTYSLSGHWQFATGICHADWVLLSGKVDGDETGTARQFIVAVDDVVVKDTWHVDGMVATGSRDVVATNVMVPAHRVSLAPPPHLFARPGDPYLIRIPIMPFLSLTAAIPAVGAAMRALELFEELVFDRVQFGTRRTQSNRVPTQVRLANLRVESTSPRRCCATSRPAFRRTPTARSTSTCRRNCSCASRSPMSCGCAATRSARSSRRAAPSVHYLDHELQRLHRDIHMISAHTVFDVDLVAEGVGRAIVAAHEAAAEEELMDALELARLYVAALSAPGEATLADLAPALADDVHGAGVFGWGDGREQVLETTAKPPFPIMGMATWSDPHVDGDRVTIKAEFPPGLPVLGATVTLADRGRAHHRARPGTRDRAAGGTERDRCSTTPSRRSSTARSTTGHR